MSYFIKSQFPNDNLTENQVYLLLPSAYFQSSQSVGFVLSRPLFYPLLLRLIILVSFYLINFDHICAQNFTNLLKLIFTSSSLSMKNKQTWEQHINLKNIYIYKRIINL